MYIYIFVSINFLILEEDNIMIKNPNYHYIIACFKNPFLRTREYNHRYSWLLHFTFIVMTFGTPKDLLLLLLRHLFFSTSFFLLVVVEITINKCNIPLNFQPSYLNNDSNEREYYHSNSDYIYIKCFFAQK